MIFLFILCPFFFINYSAWLVIRYDIAYLVCFYYYRVCHLICIFLKALLTAAGRGPGAFELFHFCPSILRSRNICKYKKFVFYM